MTQQWFHVEHNGQGLKIRPMSKCPELVKDSKDTIVVDTAHPIGHPVLLVSSDIFELMGINPKGQLDNQHPMAKFGNRKFYGVTPHLAEIIQRSFDKYHATHPVACRIHTFVLDTYKSIG